MLLRLLGLRTRGSFTLLVFRVPLFLCKRRQVEAESPRKTRPKRRRDRPHGDAAALQHIEGEEVRFYRRQNSCETLHLQNDVDAQTDHLEKQRQPLCCEDQ